MSLWEPWGSRLGEQIPPICEQDPFCYLNFPRAFRLVLSLGHWEGTSDHIRRPSLHPLASSCPAPAPLQAPAAAFSPPWAWLPVVPGLLILHLPQGGATAPSILRGMQWGLQSRPVQWELAAPLPSPCQPGGILQQVSIGLAWC